MGLIRLIILGLVIYLVYLLVKRWQASKRGRQLQPRDETKAMEDGRMVRCGHCGLFVPLDEAVRTGDTYYCSEAHRLADKRDS